MSLMQKHGDAELRLKINLSPCGELVMTTYVDKKNEKHLNQGDLKVKKPVTAQGAKEACKPSEKACKTKETEVLFKGKSVKVSKGTYTAFDLKEIFEIPEHELLCEIKNKKLIIYNNCDKVHISGNERFASDCEKAPAA